MTPAEMEAEQLVEDFGLSLPIIPKEVCSLISDVELAVTYIEEELEDSNICGLSLSHGNNVTVLVNTTISSIGRKNFTGAHEIGHVILHIQKGIESSFTCSNGDLNGSGSVTKYERQANEFASSLLMPKSLIHAKIKRNDLTWAFVQSLANECGTSLEATARRVVKLSSDPCALVIHKSGEMWTPIRSDSFTGFIHKAPFPAGLEDSSYTDTSPYLDKLNECDASDWFRDCRRLPEKILYQSIYNEEHDKRMTLLVIPEEDLDENDEWDEPTFK